MRRPTAEIAEKTAPTGAAVKRHPFGLAEDEPPERPHVFTITDEHGVNREVYAPLGRVMRWPW